MNEWFDLSSRVVSLTVTVIGGAVGGILWLGKRAFASRKDHTVLAERVVLLEAADRVGPSHEDFQQLRLDHAELAGRVEALQTDIGWIKAALGRIENFLLQRDQ